VKVRQLDLFGADAVGAVAPDAEVRALGDALPPQVHLGTSSWSFPGWRGSVYDRVASRTLLAREGLAAYARHPVLRTVGSDRSYYDPLDVDAYRAYAQSVPEHFRFLVKAHRDCTTDRRDNPRYLDAGFAADRVIAPWREGLAGRAGPLVFQFPPQRFARSPERFADELHRFLRALPPGPLYAVEIRHAAWLTPRYAEALRDAGAVPCLTVHPSMPAPAQQASRLDAPEGWPALVARWMLGGDQAYEDARRRYAPFDRLVDPDLPTRRAIARLCRGAADRGRPAFVTVNNKAEGSAPLSALALAREIDAEGGAGEPTISAR
jgi:uncharacterized protein YecE (DUF72 family)